MADLEKLALQRDRRYLVRLVLLLAAGVCVGAMMFGWLTGERTSGCIAGLFGAATDSPAQQGER